MDSGVYRLTDSNGDDQLDRVEKLKTMHARGDHGVHALLLSPDKKSIYLITGNNTDRAGNPFAGSLDWGEDICFSDADGRDNRDLLAQEVSYTKSPDGKDWEIVSSGYQYF